ncbi:MAG: Omp28-related outer membrane protein [Paludibacteraceae bacterium]
MKKLFTSVLLLAAAFSTAMAEETMYPRKFLIEHFTTEQCGYCPYGMYSIVEGIKGQEDQYIWVSHHYGYGSDPYSITENETIGTKLGVNGAPNMCLNRAIQNGQSTLCFHPGYLPEMTITDSKEAIASIQIDRTYDRTTRVLKVKVSGEVNTTELTEVRLSILIKENGLVGAQADYYWTWTGEWSEFMHTKVVRGMLTAALGDKVTVTDQAYSLEKEFTVPEAWVDSNCVIVAYITNKNYKPIINAEQVVLVEGTTGGEEIEPHGIKENVADSYPESGAPIKDITFSTVATQAMGDTLCVQMIGDNSVSAGGSKCKPVLLMYIVGADQLTNSTTYTVTENGGNGTIIPGSRDDENLMLVGSLLTYCTSTSINTGNLNPKKYWMLKSGNVTVDAEGNISIDAVSANGSAITGAYNIPTDIDEISFVKKAMKQIRDGQVILVNPAGEEYNILGTRIK